MEREDEISRRRSQLATTLIDQFKDGQIHVALVEQTLETGGSRTILQLQQMKKAGGPSEGRQTFAIEFEDFGKIIEKAQFAAQEWDRRPPERAARRDAGIPRKILDIDEGQTVAQVVERVSKDGDKQKLIYLKREDNKPEVKRLDFLGDLNQLAGIWTAAQAIERQHRRRQETTQRQSGPSPHESVTTERHESQSLKTDRVAEIPPSPQRHAKSGEAEGYLAVVRLDRLAEGSEPPFVRVVKVFPKSPKVDAYILAELFAGKTAGYVLWPEEFKNEPAKGMELEVTEDDLVKYPAELKKLDREIRNREHKKEVEGTHYVVGIWNDGASTPEPGKTIVTWQQKEPEDYRREPEDYKVTPVGTKKPQAPSDGDTPIYVLIRKDHNLPSKHVVEKIFGTREEALKEFRKREHEVTQELSRAIAPTEPEVTGMRPKF